MQVYGFTPVYGFIPMPVCARSWLLQFDELLLKYFLHCLQPCGLPPVCVRSCILQYDDWLKLLSQCLHLYGFNTVCVCSCVLHCDDLLKPLLQCLHVYGFIPFSAPLQSVPFPVTSGTLQLTPLRRATCSSVNFAATMDASVEWLKNNLNQALQFVYQLQFYVKCWGCYGRRFGYCPLLKHRKPG